jgi:hypothetical protein
MRRVFWLLLGFVAWSVSAAPLSVVEGRVTADDAALPGCTVRLGERTTVTDAEGHYAFEGVAEGEYEAVFELEGLETAEQRVLVHSEQVRVATEDLRVSEIAETITLSCGSPCGDGPPENRYDRPRCSDYELHEALLASAASGDRSSIELLRTRYTQADTDSERNRLGGMLLGKVADDSAIWNELLNRAEIPVRFLDAEDVATPAYQEWSAAHAIADPHSYWYVGLDALGIANADRRSRPLLERAIATGDFMLLYYAIEGFAKQKAFDALPLIETGIERLPEDERGRTVRFLVLFQDERADALARKYFADEDDAEEYRAEARAYAEREQH